MIECNQSSEFHLNILKTLLNSPHIDSNVTNYQDYTPFLFACSKNTDNKIIKQLMESKSVNVFAKDGFGRNAFHIAALYGHCKILAQLYQYINTNFNDKLYDFINEKDEWFGETPYVLVCRLHDHGEWIKKDKRRKVFETLINVCKVDTTI